MISILYFFMSYILYFYLISCSNNNESKINTGISINLSNYGSSIGYTVEYNSINCWNSCNHDYYYDDGFYRNNDKKQFKPTILIVGVIHGNETAGNYICEYFINQLQNSKNKKILELKDKFRFDIITCMNNDNFDLKRENNNNIDLNRDFNINDINQPETKTIMNYIDKHPEICLTIVYHCGALVVCYPLDKPLNSRKKYNNIDRCSLNKKSIPNRDSNRTYSKLSEQEDIMFKRISEKYSYYHCINLNDNNKMIDNYEKRMYESPYFQNGIINGSYWYPINGSFSDYCYIHKGIPSLTIEVSQRKNHNNINKLGKENMRALIELCNSVLKYSIKGIVLDKENNPIKDAKIELDHCQGYAIINTYNGIFFRTCANKNFKIRAISKKIFSNWIKVSPNDHNIKIIIDI